VKGYLVLLFAEYEKRKGTLSEDVYSAGKEAVLSSVKESWGSGLSRKVIVDAFRENEVMLPLINLSDQIAGILTTANQIAGNPRLIKRFLNDLNIRKTVAEAEGLSLAYEALLKLQLFERCASSAAFEFLVSEAGRNDEGKPEFLAELETSLRDDEKFSAPDKSWEDPFVADWMKLAPTLADLDLRPILNLSRTKTSATVSYDKLSPQAAEILEAILVSKKIESRLVDELKNIGETESELILLRLSRKARAEQFTKESILRAMTVAKAFPELSQGVVTLLKEIPPKTRKASLIPLLQNAAWADGLLLEWAADEKSPKPVRKAIDTH